MRKLIHTNFELDLSSLQLIDNEENPWFLDEIPLRFTFPFELDLTDENEQNFGFISSYQTSPETIYPLVYVHGNQMEEAELELEELNDKKLQATLSFGLEKLPSWDKKLSELPLDKFDLDGETIYEHAEDVIPLTYPAVNYNFPQVHVENFDAENELYNAFPGRINNTVGGSFVPNSIDPIDFTASNPTIIQPLPYWLHVLQKGFEASGLTLEGEVLSDVRLLKKCLYTSKEYFTKRDNPEYSAFLLGIDEVEQIGSSPSWGTMGKYEVIIDIAQWGKFNILGNIKRLVVSNNPFPPTTIKFNDVVIWSQSGYGQSYFVDTTFDTTEFGPNELKITIYSRIPINPNLVDLTQFIICDLQILALVLYDAPDSLVPTIINENKIDLTKAVPDMTFGDFVKTTLNWYNYDYDIKDGIVTMNRIESQMNYNNAFDLSMFEVRSPIRRFKKGYSFVLKFQDVETDYEYLPAYQSATEVLYAGFKTDDKTKTIEVNALPLPNLLRDGITTAHAFVTDESKPFAVFYGGLIGTMNITESPQAMLIPQVHETNWRNWFTNRIDAQQFTWNFKSWFDDISGLKAKGKCFAYGRYHIIKKIQRTELSPDLFEVEIETETLR